MTIRAGSRIKRATALLWLLDMLLILGAVVLAVRVRFIGDPQGHLLFIQAGVLKQLLIPIPITVAMASFGLYGTYARQNQWDLVLRLVLSFVFGGLALVATYYAAPDTYIGRGILALSLLFGFVGLFTLRTLARSFFHSEAFKRRVLVLGAGEHAGVINSALRRASDRQSFVVVGFVPLSSSETSVPERQRVEAGRGLVELAMRRQIHEIVVAPDERRGSLPMEQMLQCAQMGIAVTDLSTFFEREAGMVKLGILDPSWLVFSGGFDHSLHRRVSKRIFDLFAASALLLLAWPVMLAVALAIWLESGFPVLYWQTRVGEGGRPFNLVKFRSMRLDAEQNGQAMWASKDDNRSTRLGRFLRKARLDELPQLFNVLAGHMSFVGPRPERPHFVDILNQEIPYYRVRHCLKPGLTGWAQLRYPYGASVRDAEEKLNFDLFYVKNHGFVFDLLIMLQTVEVVLFGRGAR
jgi:sugar transferase (PEP-CTERM system associated)